MQERQNHPHWHSLALTEIFSHLNTSPEGVNSKNVAKLLEKYGKNEIPQAKERPFLLILFTQINNILNYVLMVASIFSLITKHWVDFWVIFIILIVNTSIGIYHQLKAKKITNSLAKSFESECVVTRDGKSNKINISELVPGDIISLQNGDRIPADVRFIEADKVSCVESSLTGESRPVEKITGELEAKSPLADQRNMGFAGSIMVSGEAKALVVETGVSTQIGAIALSLHKIKSEKTLFEKRTEKLAKQMVSITFLISSLIFIIGLIRGLDLTDLIQFVLATLISGIPEVLPTVLIIVLSIAAMRMSQRRALLKNLSAIESLSSITTIITDKTGTLTENSMNVQAVILPDHSIIHVNGKGWNPEGDFYLFDNDEKTIINPLKNQHLKKLVELGGFNDQADIIFNDGHWENIGDPTEASRVVLSRRAGIDQKWQAEHFSILHNIPYDQQTKYRQNIIRDKKTGKIIHLLIGGAEKIIDRLDGSTQSINQFQKIVTSYAQQTFRMQAVAYAELNLTTDQLKNLEAGQIREEDLLSLPTLNQKVRLLGILAIQDPIRKDVAKAVENAKNAGVRVIMATGDHPATAHAIGVQIGIIEQQDSIIDYDNHIYPGVLTDQDIETINDEELFEKLKTISVFARVTPATKLRLANLLQKKGEVIAMTGDGTNDAPALKKADIGIAMGRIGTDAAREASDLILLDDNFSTIISAIEEGRTVFRNVRQTSLFLLTTNFAEGLAMLTSMVLGLALPLLPLQILWLNLVTDGVSGIALATEKPQTTTLKSKPRKKSDGILNRKNLVFILTISTVMMAGTIGIFLFWMNKDLEYARTSAFLFLVFANLFNMINLRSLDIPIIKLGFFSNKSINISFTLSCFLVGMILYIPFFRDVFSFAPISIVSVFYLFIASSIIFILGEILKLAHTID